MRTALGILTAIGLLFPAGCSYDEFLIEMEPDHGVLHRQITCRRIRSRDKTADMENFSEEKARPIAGLYAERVASPDPREHIFRGTFRGQTPKDVGGAGYYTFLNCDLGFLGSYVERFRGSDDLQGQIDTIQRAADRLVDVLAGWFRSEMGESPETEKLLTFCNGQFRRDIKNAALYLWAGKILRMSEGKTIEEQIATRIGLYLAERGYFRPEDVPSLVRAVQDESSPDRPLAVVRRILARAMGLDETTASARLGFLSDTDRAKGSFEAYLRKTADYQNRLKEWEEKRKTEPEAPAPDPWDITNHLLDEMTALDLFPTLDRVRVRLACPGEPILTNGRWDGDKREVTWSSDIQKADTFPTLCYAIWSSADVEFQTAHFGKGILDGQALAEYVLWRNGLTEAEGEEWDGFVVSLKPGPGLEERVRAFVFSGERRPTEGDQERRASAADRARELILTGLGKGK